MLEVSTHVGSGTLESTAETQSGGPFLPGYTRQIRNRRNSALWRHLALATAGIHSGGGVRTASLRLCQLHMRERQ